MVQRGRGKFHKQDGMWFQSQVNESWRHISLINIHRPQTNRRPLYVWPQRGENKEENVHARDSISLIMLLKYSELPYKCNKKIIWCIIIKMTFVYRCITVRKSPVKLAEGESTSCITLLHHSERSYKCKKKSTVVSY